MQTPPDSKTPGFLPDLPAKLMLLSIHHLARLLILLNGPQPSLVHSTERALDYLLMHLDLVDLTPESKPGWLVVKLSPEGRRLVSYLLDLALPEARAASSQPSPRPSAPTPTPPPPSATPPRRAMLSLVHSRG